MRKAESYIGYQFYDELVQQGQVLALACYFEVEPGAQCQISAPTLNQRRFSALSEHDPFVSP